MVPFFEFAAVVALSGLALFVLLRWIRNTSPVWRNTAGFLVGLGAAYAGSFALDLFIGASVGFYPFQPLTIPVFTWSGIAIALHGFARFVSVSRRWLNLPYFIVGGLATMTGILGSHKYSILVGVPLILFALVSLVSGRQVAAQTGSTPARSSFPIGQYKLDTSVDGLTGLTEFSTAEYAIMGRQFEGEKNYNGPPVMFLGRQWNLQLGTVHGKIYKIAPYLELKDKKEANVVAMEALRYCTDKLGKPSEQKTGLFIWNTSDGNVVLQTAETAEGLAVNLFITSRSVRNFKRR